MSASSITLVQLRDRVEQTLVDSANEHYATGLLDEAIRLALSEFSGVSPLIKQSVLSLTGNLSANGREIDISSLSDAMTVVEVWAEYSAGDGKATVRNFLTKLDLDLVFLLDGEALLETDSARIFYATLHTLNGLDGASATTVQVGADAFLVLGAAGYALLSRAVDLTEQVTVSSSTINYLRSLAEDYLREFRNVLPPAPEDFEMSLRERRRKGIKR